MKRIKAFLKRIRIVYCKSNTLTRVVVMSAIVLSLIALLTLKLTINITEKNTENLTESAGQLEDANKKLEENIGNLGSADSVQQIAQDELGLVDPDTVVVDPEE